ncbi:MAG: APC family permease [Gammaproteobacteria bacterium]|nr:APC family permease [Gammaproteobacteria bacterium]
MKSNTKNNSSLGLFSLVMMAIVSVGSLRNLPVSAQYGFSLVTFYVLAGLMFFLPLAWVTAKLAAEYPSAGGSYLWISRAFGHSLGNVGLLLQWLYNIIWYPTLFAFITETIASLFFPNLQNNKLFILFMSLGLFWLFSLLHCRGMRISRWVSVVSALVGTLLPMIFIIGFTIYWLVLGNVSVTPMHWGALIPTGHDLKNIGFFSNILFSLLGLEIIAMYAGQVKNPGTTYPRAVSISAIILFITTVLSSLALCILIPTEKISIVTGLVDFFRLFCAANAIDNVALIVGVCIIIGALGIASSWIMGLARGFHVALCAMNSPTCLTRLNKNQVPSGILVLQAAVYSILMCAFLLFPDIKSSYWLLSAMTAQFALLYYMFLFLAAFKLLRQKKLSFLNHKLSILLPSMAFMTCLTGVLTGFIPPDFVEASSQLKYQFICGLIFMTLTVWMKTKNKFKG